MPVTRRAQPRALEMPELPHHPPTAHPARDSNAAEHGDNPLGIRLPSEPPIFAPDYDVTKERSRSVVSSPSISPRTGASELLPECHVEFVLLPNEQEPVPSTQQGHPLSTRQQDPLPSTQLEEPLPLIHQPEPQRPAEKHVTLALERDYDLSNTGNRNNGESPDENSPSPSPMMPSTNWFTLAEPIPFSPRSLDMLGHQLTFCNQLERLCLNAARVWYHSQCDSPFTKPVVKRTPAHKYKPKLPFIYPVRVQSVDLQPSEPSLADYIAAIKDKVYERGKVELSARLEADHRIGNLAAWTERIVMAARGMNGVMSDAHLKRLYMDARSLVCWLLSEEAKHEVDALWEGGGPWMVGDVRL